MPFFNKSSYLYQMDTSEYIPVNVIVNHAKDGRFIPIYFSYENEQQEVFKIKIDSISFIKDYPGYIVYCCNIAPYGRQLKFYLNFEISKCLWKMCLCK